VHWDGLVWAFFQKIMRHFPKGTELQPPHGKGKKRDTIISTHETDNQALLLNLSLLF
jgi:hypothetical protein